MDPASDAPTPLSAVPSPRGSRPRPVAVSPGHPRLRRSARRAADEVERRFDEIVALEALRMRRRVGASRVAPAGERS